MKRISHPQAPGYLLIGATLLATLALWIACLWHYDGWYEDRFKYVAKVGSLSATMLMCWAFLLATRFRPVNRCFGGLDKVYTAHRRVGEAAFVIVFLHPVFLAMHRLPDWRGFLAFIGVPTNPVRATGLIALLLLVTLVLLSIRKPMAYQRWKATHHFFGLVLLLVVFHGAISGGEIMKYPPLRYWFIVWTALGLGSFLYIRVLYRWFGPLRVYRVVEVLRHGDVTEVAMDPVSRRRRLRAGAGQFVFISMETTELGEPHPFSIASPPGDERIRIAVKELGDWTARLKQLEPGTIARLWGPYGALPRRLDEDAESEVVLIAGGIGITPFLSIVEDRERIEGRARKTWLIYSCEGEGEPYGAERIGKLGAASDRLECVVHNSDEKGFLDVAGLRARVGDLEAKSFYLCGPPPMMESLVGQLKEAGVPPGRIHTEDFSAI